MNLFIIVVAAITTIVILATKIVDLVSTITKYQREKITPNAERNTSIIAQKISKRHILKEFWDFINLCMSSAMLFWLLFSDEPIRRFDLGILGFIIIVYMYFIKKYKP
jgi:hypothetical protein